MLGDHFYTLDPNGEIALESGYISEGIACYAFLGNQSETVPIYRWYNPANGDHFYTTDPSGELAPAGGYRSEGVAFYAYPRKIRGSTEFYRWYNPANGDHFYTTDPSGELAPAGGYRPEGVACYVFKNPSGDRSPLFRWYKIGFATKFTYDPDMAPNFQNKLRERHLFAVGRIQACGNLNPIEKRKLFEAYVGRPIRHSRTNDPTIFGKATLNGNRIWINFDTLFPRGDNEIAQTLIHEMMHCIGFTHPKRVPRDRPGDNGPYYGTPPLRSEFCIAGTQSDSIYLEGKTGNIFCEIVNGQCIIRIE